MRVKPTGRACPDRRKAGFTLIELLIAMTLLAVVGIIMLGGLRMGAGAREKSEARLVETDEIVAVENILRRELSTAYPDFFTIQQGGPYVNFAGTPTSLSFRGDLPQQIGLPEIARLDLFAAAGKLVMSWRVERRNGGQGFPAEKPSEVPLLADVSRVEFAYFGPDSPNQPATWHASWDRRPVLPLLVRLRVAFAANSTKYWPDLIVAPQINADSRCLYDPVTRKCRDRP